MRSFLSCCWLFHRRPFFLVPPWCLSLLLHSPHLGGYKSIHAGINITSPRNKSSLFCCMGRKNIHQWRDEENVISERRDDYIGIACWQHTTSDTQNQVDIPPSMKFDMFPQHKPKKNGDVVLLRNVRIHNLWDVIFFIFLFFFRVLWKRKNEIFLYRVQTQQHSCIPPCPFRLYISPERKKNGKRKREPDSSILCVSYIRQQQRL